jgi:hypothetical protein
MMQVKGFTERAVTDDHMRWSSPSHWTRLNSHLGGSRINFDGRCKHYMLCEQSGCMQLGQQSNNCGQRFSNTRILMWFKETEGYGDYI